MTAHNQIAQWDPASLILLILGCLIVIVFMGLLLWRRVTPLVALITVPIVGGLVAAVLVGRPGGLLRSGADAAGAPVAVTGEGPAATVQPGDLIGSPSSLGDLVLSSFKDMVPTVALLMFAIMFFGTMIAAGLFDPIVRGILRVVGDDPLRVVVGTAVLTAVVSLDGDGSTTFLVVTSALLPIYLRLGLSPVVLTCVAGMTNGVLNIVPWGGPTARAAAAMGVDPGEVFNPMIPSLIVGLLGALTLAWLLGRSERRRLGGDGMSAALARHSQSLGGRTVPGSGATATVPSLAGSMLDPERATLRPRLYLVNLVLTIAVLLALIAGIWPLSLIFMCGTALALLINYPRLAQQQEIILSQATSIVAVTSMVFAAGVLVGVLSGTGMVAAMAQGIVAVIPPSWGPFLAPLTGVLSMPLTFFLSNDAFYFGILPILSEAAAQWGISPVEMARASITGQPLHMQSPLVPAILLLLSLSGVSLTEHHRRVLWRAVVLCLLMLVTAIIVGAVPWGR